MSQQINLFNPLFRPKAFSLTSAAAIAYAVVLTLAAALLLAGYERYQLVQARAAAHEVDLKYQTANARAQQLATEVTRQKPNPVLAAEVASLEKQLKGRREIVEALDSGAVGSTEGFSEFMRALSRQNVSGLWLTGFDIAQGGSALTINGRTINADLVAAYLNRLNREKSLKGKEFAALRINQPLAAPADAAKAPAASTRALTPTAQGKATSEPAPRFLEFTISTASLTGDAKPPGTADPEAPAVRKTIATTEVIQ